jgi:hypothetical protein
MMGDAEIRLDTLDSLSEAGRPSNEDAAGSTRAAAWVIDGTKGPFDHTLTPGPTDATWHAQALNSALFAQYAELPVDPSLSLARVAELLSDTYARNSAAAPPHEQPSACLAMVALGASMKLHLFNIGDCRILIEKAGKVCTFGTSGIEQLETAAIVELTRLRDTMGDAYDPWPQLRGKLRRNFETAMNMPGGYWVVHPSLPWLHAVEHAEFSVCDVDHVLIVSDGFFRLVNVFGACDAAGLVTSALRVGGLAALCAELRRQEADDPTCRRYPRLKSVDDASAVLIRIRR